MSEVMGDTVIRMCAPVNTPSGLNRPHNVTRMDGFKLREDGTERKTRLRGERQESMFDCYINNCSIDTYDMVLVSIDNDSCNPCKEYLMHLPSGYLAASLIGQTHNPHVVQSAQESYTPEFIR